MENPEEADEFLLSLNPLQLDVYNEYVKMGYHFDVIKTWLNDYESYEFNKDPKPYLTILQQESGEQSMPQSSDNSSDKKILVKKRLVKPSRRLLGEIMIPRSKTNHDSYFCPRRFQIYEQSQSTP